MRVLVCIGLSLLLSAAFSARSGAQDHRIQAGARKPVSAAWRRALADRGEPSVLRGEALKTVSMPVGGIGARHFALGGDGLLSEAHAGGVPRNVTIKELLRVGSGSRNEPTPRGAPPMEVVLAVKEAGRWNARALRANAFGRAYPVGRWQFPAVAGVEVKLEAFGPMIPLNTKDSALPAVILEYTLTNTGRRPLKATIAVGLQNFVGLLVKKVDGVKNWSYGGNLNRVVRGEPSGWTMLHMTRDRALAPRALPPEVRAELAKAGGKRRTRVSLPAAEGDLALAVADARASYHCSITDMKEIVEALSERGRLPNRDQSKPTPRGRTVNGALARTVSLSPGRKETVTFVFAWYFPNDTTRHGIEYSNWFSSARDACGTVAKNVPALSKGTHEFSDALFEGTLPWWLLDAVGSNISLLRSGTAYWTKSQGFFVFEGEYCCSNNCAHVWGYAQTHAFLWPEIGRDMRITELEWNLSPAGCLPERPGVWSRGSRARPLPAKPERPEKPGALDGSCAAVLALYREHLHSVDDAFLRRMWPRAKRVLDNIAAYHDPDGDGVLDGKQYTTYDHNIVGPNTFIGSYWLAALRAGEEMAARMKDPAARGRYRALFEKGRAGYAKLFNGEFYRPHGGPEARGGCLADQLIGQWWARVLGLGDILPAKQVKTTLASIYKYNFITDWGKVKQGRKFASPGEKGLINVSWPRRPPPPRHFLNYHNECWTGIEYQVAAHMIYEGMTEEGLAVARGARERYLSGKRNPFSEIECGPYYARALSSYSLLAAAQGYHYDGPARLLRFAPRIAPKDHRSFFVVADGWGTFTQELGSAAAEARIAVRGGKVSLKTLELGVLGWKRATAELDGRRVPAQTSFGPRGLVMKFRNEISIPAGKTLRVTLGKTR